MRTFVKAHPGAGHVSDPHTGHGVRAATRLTLRSSRSSPRRLLARLSRHRSRRPRPPPRVRRHWRGPPPGARPAVELTGHLPSLCTHRHIPSSLYAARSPRCWGSSSSLRCAPMTPGARRSSEVPSEEASSSSLRPTASSHRPPPPSPPFLCRYVPLGRAGDRSFKMKSKERHALLARYAARFNRPRDEAPPSKAGGDCGCD